MWIGTQISSYMIPGEIWLSGYAGHPPLTFPARDALDIERRWRKGVDLRKEARRYVGCCERMQGIARDLALAAAPIPAPCVWSTYGRRDVSTPSALAYLAIFEYLRRFYTIARRDQSGVLKRERLRYHLAEAIFHPPGKRMSDFLTLLAHVKNEPKLSQMCADASQKAEVADLSFKVSAEECQAAFQQRYGLVAKCVEDGFGLVDVFDIV